MPRRGGPLASKLVATRQRSFWPGNHAVSGFRLHSGLPPAHRREQGVYVDWILAYADRDIASASHSWRRTIRRGHWCWPESSVAHQALGRSETKPAAFPSGMAPDRGPDTPRDAPAFQCHLGGPSACASALPDGTLPTSRSSATRVTRPPRRRRAPHGQPCSGPREPPARDWRGRSCRCISGR